MSNPEYIVKSGDDPAGFTAPYHIVRQIGNTIFNTDFFGIPVSLPQTNAYAYSIFPIIVAAWLAARIEPWLKMWIPAVIRSIFAPLLEIFIVSTLVLVVFGPTGAGEDPLEHDRYSHEEGVGAPPLAGQDLGDVEGGEHHLREIGRAHV